MSLINDALKRATSLRKKEPVPGPEGMPPLEPVQGKSVNRSKGMTIALAAVLVALFGYVAWSQFGESGNTTTALNSGATNKTGKIIPTVAAKSKTPENVTPSTPNTNNVLARAASIAEGIRQNSQEGEKAAEQVIMGPANTVQAKADPATQPNDAKAQPAPLGSDSSPIPALASKQNTDAEIQNSSKPTASPEFPSVQVQAIYYRTRNPAAVVNGKTIREGEEIDGVKIAQIARDQIRMEFQGQSKTVSLR